MARRRDKPPTHAILGVVAGLIFGFFVVTWSRSTLVPCTPGPNGCCGANRFNQDGEVLTNSLPDTGSPEGGNLVFIGVMTAQRYLDGRAIAVHNTWANTIPGKVVFFSSAGSQSNDGVPVVSLPGVDDTYPPQKKSFLMLKYMHDNFLDKYEWFMRADDDVYIKGDKLATFLYSINSSKPQFIGQAGQGTKEEFGQLSLERNENFCMGGPGIIFSRETLRRMVPHISFCLKNLYTTHEDVEIGRCVRKFAGVPCTWAFEMQHLFYQNHREKNGSFTHSLKVKEVHRAVTLHPVKNHVHQYRIYNYFSAKKSCDLRHRTLLLQRQIDAMTQHIQRVPLANQSRLGLPPTLVKFRPQTRDHVLSWDFLSRAVYSDTNVNMKRGIEQPLKIALDDIMMQVMQMINKNARQRGRTIDFKEILYGYRRVNPLHGSDYILDLLLVYRKHKGRRMTVPVRRHAYLQQTFTQIEFTEDEDVFASPKSMPKTTTIENANHFLKFVQNRLSQFYNTGTSDRPVQPASVNRDMNKTIHFILPLAGRYLTFRKFMSNFENVCLKMEENAKLAVILFQGDTTSSQANTIEYMKKIKNSYPKADLRIVEAKGSFSRAVALEQGGALYGEDALLYFVDVDIYFTKASLQRIRLNTIQHKQVYFPIVYSQYDPRLVCGNTTCTDHLYQFSTESGYWRLFGFGIASMFRSDLSQVGGFDTTIQGWGKEDVDLFTKFVSSNITIFRSVEPGMIHIFHPIICDAGLESAQYQMCLGSKAASYGATGKLADAIYRLPDVLEKNEKKHIEEVEVT